MSSMAPATNSQQETEIVTGVIAGITQKGPDKWQVAVQPNGSQYAKNLWTKDANLVAQLSMMLNSPASFQCGVSHWQRADGQAVRSLWVNGVGPAQEAVAVQPASQTFPQPMQAFQAAPAGLQVGQPTVQVSQGGKSDAVQSMIHRQTATKVASMLISHMPAEERTFDTLLMISERLVAYYDHGLAGLGQAPAFGAATDDADDIPF